MTVSSSTDRATFLGNGVTVNFDLPFRFFTDGEINAWLITNATGALTPLTLGTHYTLTGASEPEVDGSATGQLTMLTPPTSAQSLFVQRIIPVTQPTDIVNQGQFFPEIHENVFDRLTMLIQQSKETVARALRVQDSDPEPARLPPVAERFGKLLSFDSLGNPIAVAAEAQSATALSLLLAEYASPTSGAALVGRAIRHINSVAELRALAGRYDGEVVYLRGRTAAISIGHGEFRWSSASVAADDDGVVVSKWLRQVSGPVLADWYGVAVANSAAINTPMLQAAVDQANASGNPRVRLPGQGIILSNALTGTSTIAFTGDGVFFSDSLYQVAQDYVQHALTLPAAFSWFPGKLYSGGAPGSAKTNINVDSLWYAQEVSGITPVYISPDGNDANSGSAPNAPKKTLAAAISAGAVGIIYAAPGTYYGGIGTAIGTTVARDIRIFSQSGGKDVVVRTGVDTTTLTWTLNTGSTYEAVPGLAINQVFDGSIVDDNGDFYRLTARDSIANVNANPGSWWYDSGTSKVYVRMPTNRSPDTDAVLFGSSVGTVTGNRGLYLRGIRFEGGGLQLIESGGVRPRLYMYNSDQIYGANFNIDSDGGTTYLEDVIVAHAGLDNLNYHDQGAVSARAVEINVTSYGAGYLKSGDENKNASSMHDTGSVVRVNGNYFDSYGPNIPDTGTSSSYNVGVSAYRSIAPTASQDVNFYSDGGMYLVDCFSGKGSSYDIRVVTGTVQVRNLQGGDTYLREASGKVQQF